MDELDEPNAGRPTISGDAAKWAALGELDDIERGFALAREAWSRDVDDWWEQASHEERLAYLDPALCGDPTARERAAAAKAAIEERRTRTREQFIASSRHWRWAIARTRPDALAVLPARRPRARGAGRPAPRRRAHRTRAGPSGASDDSGDPPEPPARRLVTTALARLIHAARHAMRKRRQ